MNYIPRNEAEFDSWGNNFVSYASTNSESLKLTPEQIAALTQHKTSWDSAYQDYLSAKSALEAARQKKYDARKAFESLLREMAQRVKVDKKITDNYKAALGINVNSGTRRRVRVPTTKPLGRINAGERLSHLIYFTDEETPTRRGKPAGVMGCEVWLKLGDAAPIDLSEWQFLGTTTSSSYTVNFRGDAGGKTAHYMLRWVNTRGEVGPWSQTFYAIVQN